MAKKSIIPVILHKTQLEYHYFWPDPDHTLVRIPLRGVTQEDRDRGTESVLRYFYIDFRDSKAASYRIPGP